MAWPTFFVFDSYCRVLTYSMYLRGFPRTWVIKLHALVIHAGFFLFHRRGTRSQKMATPTTGEWRCAIVLDFDDTLVISEASDYDLRDTEATLVLFGGRERLEALSRLLFRVQQHGILLSVVSFNRRELIIALLQRSNLFQFFPQHMIFGAEIYHREGALRKALLERYGVRQVSCWSKGLAIRELIATSVQAAQCSPTTAPTAPEFKGLPSRFQGSVRIQGDAQANILFVDDSLSNVKDVLEKAAPIAAMQIPRGGMKLEHFEAIEAWAGVMAPLSANGVSRKPNSSPGRRTERRPSLIGASITQQACGLSSVRLSLRLMHASAGLGCLSAALPMSIDIRPSGRGAGLGAFATRAIANGQTIVEEKPLVRWSREVGNQPRYEETGEAEAQGLLAALSTIDSRSRVAYFELCSPKEPPAAKTALGIWESNAFAVDERDAFGLEGGAVFEHISRFNHCCRPNAEHSWDPLRRVKVLKATRNIAADEEIFISYLGNASILHIPRERRRASLMRTFGWECACTRCERGDEADDALFRRDEASASEVLLDADGDPIIIWSRDVYGCGV